MPDSAGQSILRGFFRALKNTGSFGGGGDPGPDIYKKVLGKSSDELAAGGAQDYPDVAAGSRHHAAAARTATSLLRPGLGAVLSPEMADVMSWALPQIGGLGVEAGEATMKGLSGINPFSDFTDTVNDVKANARGSYDALARGLEKGKAKVRR